MVGRREEKAVQKDFVFGIWKYAGRKVENWLRAFRIFWLVHGGRFTYVVTFESL